MGLWPTDTKLLAVLAAILAGGAKFVALNTIVFSNVTP
jgi:hypothetical protein